MRALLRLLRHGLAAIPMALLATAGALAAPTVTLSLPTTTGIVSIPYPSSYLISSSASPAAGTTIAKVELFVNGTLVQTCTTSTCAKPLGLIQPALTAGTYLVVAKATDSLGAEATAALTMLMNASPTVAFTGIVSGQVLPANQPITLTATAADSDGSVIKVEFFQGLTTGMTLVGTSTSPPYAATWSNPPSGSRVLQAKATDNHGATGSSYISVVVNASPTVSLTSPVTGTVAVAPASLALGATAADSDGTIAKVEFFSGSTLVGSAYAPPWNATWANVPQGSYQITAVATDGFGGQTTSAPAAITVTPAQASLYFIHPDHLGTPRMVTDETNNVVWRNLPTTEPFGSGTVEEDPNATGNPFTLNLRFPGQYFDRESNLAYNYYRDGYDPARGSYSQSDPIGLAGGINTYTYVNGNPVSYTDPEGLRTPMSQGTMYRGTGDIQGQIWTGNQMRNGAIQNYDSLQRRAQDLFNPQVGTVCKRTACDLPIPQNQCTSSNPSGGPTSPSGPQMSAPGACQCVEWTTGWLK